MSLVVGWRDKEAGVTTIASDSLVAGSKNWSANLLNQPKVFAKAGWLFGCVWSGAMHQVVQHGMDLSFMTSVTDLSQVCLQFIPPLRRIMKEYGVAYHESEEGLTMEGEMLIGRGGKLFHVTQQFYVVETTTPFEAVGTGADVALGAFFAQENWSRETSPDILCRNALLAAEAHNMGGPWPVHNLGGVDD